MGAVIRCGGCSKRVSSADRACPHCGVRNTDYKRPGTQQRPLWVGLGLVLAVVAVLGVGFLAFDSWQGRNVPRAMSANIIMPAKHSAKAGSQKLNRPASGTTIPKQSARGKEPSAAAVAEGLWGSVMTSPLATGDPDPTLLEQAREALATGGGYLPTLAKAYWAVRQGPAIIPAIRVLLEDPTVRTDGMGSTSAFPFNAYCALAMVPDPKAGDLLEVRSRRGSDTSVATKAAQAWRLRTEKQSASFGVTIRDEGPLYAEASALGAPIAKLPAGEAVEILEERMEVATETDPRGGPAIFDRVRVLASEQEGYLQRAGDGFKSWF